jgi:hypothetical protein
MCSLSFTSAIGMWTPEQGRCEVANPTPFLQKPPAAALHDM